MLAKVIEASPGAVEAYKEMARVKIAQNRPQEALADANLAAAMAENDPEAQALADRGQAWRARCSRSRRGRPTSPCRT